MTSEATASIEALGTRARAAARRMRATPTGPKNEALRRAAALICEEAAAIGEANGRDVRAAEGSGLSASMKDRLTLTPDRIEAMAAGLEQVAALPDPVGEIGELVYRSSGIQVGRMRVPLGVIGMIYESRPNVTADAAALTLKSGNAVILRGGSEAIHSNRAIADLLRRALRESGVPEDAVQLIDSTDRALVGALLRAEAFVDVIIPRGGRSLIERVAAESRVPVIKHLDGVCHVYVDAGADLAMAERIAVNAKTQRPGVCNAMETLLVHASVADAFLPKAAAALRKEGVELRGCERTRAIVAEGIDAAGEEDWRAEYLSLVVSVRVVADLDAAIDHIGTYGSGHTESIVTADYDAGQRFLREVDSASVMWNASTRFADGAEYGLGAEIGISTDRLHVRGPVGLEGLTTQKWIVLGHGEIRE